MGDWQWLTDHAAGWALGLSIVGALVGYCARLLEVRLASRSLTVEERTEAAKVATQIYREVIATLTDRLAVVEAELADTRRQLRETRSELAAASRRIQVLEGRYDDATEPA